VRAWREFRGLSLEEMSKRLKATGVTRYCSAGYLDLMERDMKPWRLQILRGYARICGGPRDAPPAVQAPDHRERARRSPARTVGGMSGSPIVAPDGSAIGIVVVGIEGSSTPQEGPHPALTDQLPGWLIKELTARTDAIGRSPRESKAKPA